MSCSCAFHIVISHAVSYYRYVSRRSCSLVRARCYNGVSLIDSTDRMATTDCQLLSTPSATEHKQSVWVAAAAKAAASSTAHEQSMSACVVYSYTGCSFSTWVPALNIPNRKRKQNWPWLQTASSWVAAPRMGWGAKPHPNMSALPWNILVNNQEVKCANFSNFDRFCSRNL